VEKDWVGVWIGVWICICTGVMSILTKYNDDCIFEVSRREAKSKILQVRFAVRTRTNSVLQSQKSSRLVFLNP
jgi:hypothetical protein